MDFCLDSICAMRNLVLDRLVSSVNAFTVWVLRVFQEDSGGICRVALYYDSFGAIFVTLFFQIIKFNKENLHHCYK